ncbi:MAG: relaxase/mobilization nuclease domain-containing protein [Acidobacteria bacterium]|nr:relaxase/mobilization nuclease domain-containing protein [Acidobacteriota bacterium]
MPILKVSSGKSAQAIMHYCAHGGPGNEETRASSVLDALGGNDWHQTLSRFQDWDEMHPNRTHSKNAKGYWMIMINLDPDDPKTPTLGDYDIHELGSRFMEKSAPGHDYVGFVHRDRAHPHLHLIVHPVDQTTGKRLVVGKKRLMAWIETTHHLAKAYGLHQTPLGGAMEREPDQKWHPGQKKITQAFQDLKVILNEAKRSTTDWEDFPNQLNKRGVLFSMRGSRCIYHYQNRKYTSRKLGEAYAVPHLKAYFGRKSQKGSLKEGFSFEDFLRSLDIAYEERSRVSHQSRQWIFEHQKTQFKVCNLRDGSWHYQAYRGQEAWKGDWETTPLGRQISFRIPPSAEETKRKMAANLVDLREIATEQGWKLRKEGRFWVGYSEKGHLSLVPSRRGVWHFKLVPEQGPEIRGKGLQFATKILSLSQKEGLEAFASRPTFSLDAFQRAMYGDIKKLLKEDRFSQNGDRWVKGEKQITVQERDGKQTFSLRLGDQISQGTPIDYLVAIRKWHPLEALGYLQKRTYFPHEEDRARFASPALLREYGYQAESRKGHWLITRSDESRYVCRPTKKGWWIQGENILGSFRGNLLSFGSKVLGEEPHVVVQKFAERNEVTPRQETSAEHAALDQVAYGLGFRLKNKALGPDGVWLVFAHPKTLEQVLMRPDENGKWHFREGANLKGPRDFLAKYGGLEGTPGILHLARYVPKIESPSDRDLAWAKAASPAMLAKQIGFKGTANVLHHPNLGELIFQKKVDGWHYHLRAHGHEWQGDGLDFAMRFCCLTRAQAIQTLGQISVGRQPELPKWGEALSLGVDAFLRHAQHKHKKNDPESEEREKEKSPSR